MTQTNAIAEIDEQVAAHRAVCERAVSLARLHREGAQEAVIVDQMTHAVLVAALPSGGTLGSSPGAPTVA